MADEFSDAVAFAIDLEEKGQFKDAYFSFTSTSQKILVALNEIKFVHSSIISSPKQHPLLISLLKICTTHIQNIIETHSTSFKPISVHTTGDSLKGPPPPLPPKPSRIQHNKPTIPPKPSPTSQSELPDNSEATLLKPRIPYTERPSSLPPPKPRVPNTVNRPQTEYVEKEQEIVPIIAEGQIDPNYLVPAQTSAGDSLAPSISTLHVDHIPLIPAPPLLTTHRLLQQKLDELEDKVKQCKAQRQQHPNDDNLDQMIAQYLGVMAELKINLNSVRTIYMSAATIPTVLQFGAHIIAYQITLIEYAIFNAIPPKALLQHSSKHPHPRIVASTDFFNYLTRCIEHSILLPQEASSRAQLIHYWIKVASRCFDINNYQSLKAIISALNTPPVQRLKRTWAYIPKKSTTKLDTLNDLMSESNNYGAYREHMGMVSTTVVNGKSAQSIRDEHFPRPTVPFLGTFIHDMTYLLAAFQSKGGSATNAEQGDPRIAEVLNNMLRFQTGPCYTPQLPQAFLKSSQKHHFRPAISNALHRGASRIQRFSGSNLFGSSTSYDNNGSSGNSGNSSNNSMSNLSNISERNSIDEDGDDGNLEEQQKMATQYMLMRPWVSQNTVDELSTLREPPQMKSNSLYGQRSSSTGPASMNRTSSVFSNSSSNLRFSTGSVSMNTISTANGDSRPTSMDEYDEKPGFFSNFKKSDRPMTMQGLSKEEQDQFHVVDKRSTWNTNSVPAVTVQAPIVPPRPSAVKHNQPQQNDEFKQALAQRLAKVNHD